MVERCVRFFVFERPVGALHADAANRISPGACISIDYRSIIYLSIFRSLYVYILHFKENRPVLSACCIAICQAVCPLLLSVSHVSPPHFSSCFLSLAPELGELCSFFSVRFFQNSISALAGVLLSLCYLCYLMLSLCYLCAIYAISGGGQCFDLCYLCAIYAISCSGELFALCYLCYLCAISLISLEYFSQICGLYTD